MWRLETTSQCYAAFASSFRMANYVFGFTIDVTYDDLYIVHYLETVTSILAQLQNLRRMRLLDRFPSHPQENPEGLPGRISLLLAKYLRDLPSMKNLSFMGGYINIACFFL